MSDTVPQDCTHTHTHTHTHREREREREKAANRTQVIYIKHYVYTDTKPVLTQTVQTGILTLLMIQIVTGPYPGFELHGSYIIGLPNQLTFSA